MKPDSTMGIGLYVWYFIPPFARFPPLLSLPSRVPAPFPRASAPPPSLGVPLCFYTPGCGVPTWPGALPTKRRDQDQQHSSKAWRLGNWQAHAGFLVFRESGARAIRSPRPCLCLVRLVAEIFDICFVVCRYKKFFELQIGVKVVLRDTPA